MLRLIVSALGLFALWLLLSGVYKPLVVGLGAASSVFAAAMLERMNRLDGHRLGSPVRPVRAIGYFFWILKEIALSNIAVARIILTGKGQRPNFFRVPLTQKTELGAVIFANSITLTPGTLSVEVEEDSLWVHAIGYADDTMEALAEMDRRVSAVEAA